MIMQMPIDQIKIKKRVRKDMGNLHALMASLQEHGLMNPIVINKKNELIAGHRRLESAKLLGWQVITVTILDKATELEKLELELEENVQRMDLADDELAEAKLRLAKLRNPGLFRKIISAIIRFFQKLLGTD